MVNKDYLYWKECLVEKMITKHGVMPDEVEEVLENDPEIRKGPKNKNRYYVYGQSTAGRYLFIIIDNETDGTVPVTARDMTPKEKRSYRRRINK